MHFDIFNFGVGGLPTENVFPFKMIKYSPKTEYLCLMLFFNNKYGKF